jgi:hypothetical protein
MQLIQAARQLGKSTFARLLAAINDLKDRVAAAKEPAKVSTASNGTGVSLPQSPHRFVRPGRAVIRAIKQGRESRLPSEWRQFLALKPKARDYILTAF